MGNNKIERLLNRLTGHDIKVLKQRDKFVELVLRVDPIKLLKDNSNYTTLYKKARGTLSSLGYNRFASPIHTEVKMTDELMNRVNHIKRNIESFLENKIIGHSFRVDFDDANYDHMADADMLAINFVLTTDDDDIDIFQLVYDINRDHNPYYEDGFLVYEIKHREYGS